MSDTRHPTRPGLRAATAFAVTAALAAAPAFAQDAADGVNAPADAIIIELNKLEPVDGGCNTYFVVRNDTDHLLQTLLVDSFIFRPDGIIENRVRLNFANVMPDNIRVAPFVLGVDCGEIGRLHVNDVVECVTPDGALDDCAALLETTSRASASFTN